LLLLAAASASDRLERGCTRCRWVAVVPRAAALLTFASSVVVASTFMSAPALSQQHQCGCQATYAGSGERPPVLRASGTRVEAGPIAIRPSSPDHSQRSS